MTDPDPDRGGARLRSWQEMRDWIAGLLVRRTGEGVEAWNATIRELDPPHEASLRAWLTEQGITGYPQMVLVMERFGYPDYLTASADELIEGQYRDRPALRPVLDAVLTRLPAVGQATVQARKTYVAFVTPRRTFAALQPTTKRRADLGLRLADPPPSAMSPHGRLEAAPSFGQSSVTVTIGPAAAE